ncbi:MAG: hypothetical protein PHI58_04795 [Candidatus Omnitrophica bacterium]|nr:hypothetical protein [Candidatus Omnitrophota bacterium]
MKKAHKIFLAAVSIFVFAFIFSAAADAALFTGNDWMKLSNAKKVAEVKAFISDVRSQGIVVKGDPVEYAKRLDRVYKKHPDLLAKEVAKTLKTVMIMDYDWEIKGMNKDTIAKQWLGEELYNKNKLRREKKGK